MKTLQELIDQCGPSFNSLSRVRRDGRPISSMVGDDNDMVWQASCWEKTVFGETPEEALEKLLLELNPQE